MARKPAKPSAKLSNGLLDAISFLSAVTKDTGAPYETHLNLSFNTAVAYNDTLSAGVIITEDIVACPNAKIFKQALSRCNNEYTLSIDGTKIIVKSGKFKAIVPCIDATLLTTRNPDPATIQLDDRFKSALSCIDVLKPEPNADKIYLVAFLMNGQTVITTDGKIVIEYWHGIDMPTLAIPKAVISAITGINKNLTGFGFSATSCTFHFEDRSFIKSQLYADQWPMETTAAILNKNCNPSAVPPDFFPGLDAVAPFSENGSIYFERDKIRSHKADGIGAVFDVVGLPAGPIYSSKYLNMIKSLATRIDFAVSANGVVSENGGYLLFWFGQNVRGVIAGHG